MQHKFDKHFKVCMNCGLDPLNFDDIRFNECLAIPNVVGITHILLAKELIKDYTNNEGPNST